MTASRTLIFGDSITTGHWDSEGGWADHLKRDLHRISVESGLTAKYQAYNLGVGSDTSARLAARVESEINARYSPSWPLSFVLAIGINDHRETDGIKQPEVAIDKFVENLTQIAAACRAQSDRILIVGFTPIAGDVLQFKNLTFYHDRIATYDARAKTWAREQSLPFVDTFDHCAGSRTYMDSLIDGLHPGAPGHQVLYELIKPQVFSMLGITQ